MGRIESAAQNTLCTTWWGTSDGGAKFRDERGNAPDLVAPVFQSVFSFAPSPAAAGGSKRGRSW